MTGCHHGSQILLRICISTVPVEESVVPRVVTGPHGVESLTPQAVSFILFFLFFQSSGRWVKYNLKHSMGCTEDSSSSLPEKR